MTEKDDKERIRGISKKIKKCIREEKRTMRQERIQQILEELKGTKNISNIKSAKRRILIPKIKNKKEETINTRKGIANVFAEFYENLHEGEEGEEDKKEKETESRTEVRKSMPNQFNPIPEITKSEIQDAIDRLKKGKAKDSSGVGAEQLQKLQR